MRYFYHINWITKLGAGRFVWYESGRKVYFIGCDREYYLEDEGLYEDRYVRGYAGSCRFSHTCLLTLLYPLLKKGNF